MLDADRIDRLDLAEVAKLMTSRGYKKGANGFWAKPDGSAWQIALSTVQGDPQGPVLTQQLRNAGFDVVNNAQQRTALSDATTVGNFDLSHGTHCGSLYDPWQTLEHFHTKYSAKPGEKVRDQRAPTRYENPAYDAIIDKLEAMKPSSNDPAYVELVRQATAIYMRDIPEITLAEEFHTLAFNYTYWTGWPNAKEPYVAPFPPWEGFAMVIHRLRPTR